MIGITAAEKHGCNKCGFFFGGGGVVFLIKKILMHETLDNKIFQIHFQSLTDLHVLCFFFYPFFSVHNVFNIHNLVDNFPF